MWKWKKLDNYQMNILYSSNNHTLSLEIFTSQKEEKRLMYQEQNMMCDVKTKQNIHTICDADCVTNTPAHETFAKLPELFPHEVS